MNKIMLYGCGIGRIVLPVNLDELMKAIDSAVSNYCKIGGKLDESSELRAVIYDDSSYHSGNWGSLGKGPDGDNYPLEEEEFAYNRALYESGNLLFAKDGEDFLLYQEDTGDYIDEDGKAYSSPSEAYLDWTHRDYSGEIRHLFSAFEPYLKANAADKFSYYSDAAKKEEVDFVRVRYEEKADFWNKILHGEEVTNEEIARCGPGHNPSKIDLYVHYQHCVNTWAKGDTEFLRNMNNLLPDALHEAQVISVQKAMRAGNRLIPYEVGIGKPGKNQFVEREESFSF